MSNIDFLLVQTLATAFVPIYIHIKTNNPENSKKFVSNVIKFFLLVTTIIAIIVTVTGPIISKILAPSYSSELTSELTSYVRIFAPTVIIIVEIAVFNALLKANESFIPGELIGVNQSLILIALVLIIGEKIGPDTIVVAFYTYAVFNLLFLMCFSNKYWHIERGNPFKDPDIRRMLTMMGPLILGYSVVFVNQQVDKIIVSGLGEGIITAMGYAAVLANFINTFVASICGVLFTYITKSVAEKNNKAAADLVTQSMIQMGTALLPISILTLMNANDIVTIAFGRGKFDLTAVGNCSLALAGYSFMFVPYSIREIFSRFQYAYGDTKKPMMNSTIAIGFNVVFSIVLSMWLGVLGVALATSLSVLLCGLLNIVTSQKRNSYLDMKQVVKTIPRWLIGIVICIAVSIIGQRALVDIHVLLRFIITTIVALILYCIVNYSTIKTLVKEIIHK